MSYQRGAPGPLPPGVISLRVASPSPSPAAAGSFAQAPVRSEFALTAEFEGLQCTGMNESGRDRDSQMIPGAWTQSSVANPAYGTRTCTAAFAPRRARNDCAKTGTVSSGAQTGGETGGWRRGCRGKTRAVRCPPTPLAPSARVRSIALTYASKFFFVQPSASH